MHVLDKNKLFSNFSYLENRSYVHGTSLVHGLTSAIEQWELGTLEHLIVSYKRTLKSQACYELLEEGHNAEKLKNSYVTFEVVCSAKKYLVALYPIDKPVISTLCYDEDVLISGNDIDFYCKKIKFMWTKQAPFINTIISLNKALLNTCLESKKHSKWLFYKCEMQWAPANTSSGELSIYIEKSLGFQVVHSSVYLDNKNIGSIFFSRSVQ